jgi:hypothetical protein
MTEAMSLTEACRVSFDYMDGFFDKMVEANRAAAWLKDTFHLKIGMDRIMIDGKNKYIIYIKDTPDGTIKFWPQDASFRTWADYARDWSQKINFAAHKKEQQKVAS